MPSTSAASYDAVKSHDAIADRRPAECPVLQPFPDQHHARASHAKIFTRGSFGPENEDRPRDRILAERLMPALSEKLLRRQHGAHPRIPSRRSYNCRRSPRLLLRGPTAAPPGPGKHLQPANRSIEVGQSTAWPASLIAVAPCTVRGPCRRATSRLVSRCQNAGYKQGCQRKHYCED
jgi:hypothetical protein